MAPPSGPTAATASCSGLGRARPLSHSETWRQRLLPAGSLSVLRPKPRRGMIIRKRGRVFWRPRQLLWSPACILTPAASGPRSLGPLNGAGTEDRMSQGSPPGIPGCRARATRSRPGGGTQGAARHDGPAEPAPRGRWTSSGVGRSCSSGRASRGPSPRFPLGTGYEPRGVKEAEDAERQQRWRVNSKSQADPEGSSTGPPRLPPGSRLSQTPSRCREGRREIDWK